MSGAMRVGPRMLQALHFVTRNPGCSMLDVAASVGPRGSLKYGYATVHRAINAGVIVAVRRKRGPAKFWLYADMAARAAYIRVTLCNEAEGPLPPWVDPVIRYEARDAVDRIAAPNSPC